jgi:putative hydrolase of the HAD superfamily
MARAAHTRSRTMQIRAVIFDYGGVLCYPPTSEQLTEAAALCGLPMEEFWSAFWRKRREYDRGHDAKAYWQDIASSAGIALDDGMIAEMIRREIEFWNRFDERVLGWARRLRDSGLRTGILSNLPRPLGESLRATPGFLDHFDHVTFSYELGYIKPERPIYEHAVRGLAVSPSEALFLDDRPENVEGAREAGLWAELFTTWDDFLTRHRERYSLPEPLR